ncbi:AI-2E family transporter [Anaerorhabdus sp.]|uniref:AI-2E family transporter n=1 Tax=Anaerorhabdus sp. TaxID=1872524 RepID=UPI002FC77B9A
MKWAVKFKEKIQNNLSLNVTFRIVAVLFIVYLLSLTSHVWMSIFKTVLKIALPFIIGFIIAYLLHPIVSRLEKMGISRKLVIPVLFIIVILLLCTLIFAISPTIYTRIVAFINSISQGVNSLFEIYKSLSENAPSPIVQAMVLQFNQMMNGSKTLLPNFSVLIPQIFNGFISFLTNTLLTIIVSFYFLIDYEKVTSYIDYISEAINADLVKIYDLVDDQIGSYLHGLLILMIIKFIEYSVLYSLVGHKDWVIIALLTSIGLVIPYFGATVANLVGILTALTLPTSNIVILIIGILILSNFDAYIIGPLVHLKNSQVEPLWTLFSIITGGILFGSIGVMISIPVFMICRVLFNFYREKSNSEVKDSL